MTPQKQSRTCWVHVAGATCMLAASVASTQACAQAQPLLAFSQAETRQSDSHAEAGEPVDSSAARHGPGWRLGSPEGHRARMGAVLTRPRAALASFYHDRLHGQRTASGERYDRAQLTAAHRTLPLGTWLRVVNMANERAVLVRVNDRGPFLGARVLDLSRRAAQMLGGLGAGVLRVRMEVVRQGDEQTPANKAGSDA